MQHCGRGARSPQNSQSGSGPQQSAANPNTSERRFFVSFLFESSEHYGEPQWKQIKRSAFLPLHFHIIFCRSGGGKKRRSQTKSCCNVSGGDLFLSKDVLGSREGFFSVADLKVQLVETIKWHCTVVWDTKWTLINTRTPETFSLKPDTRITKAFGLTLFLKTTTKKKQPSHNKNSTNCEEAERKCKQHILQPRWCYVSSTYVDSSKVNVLELNFSFSLRPTMTSAIGLSTIVLLAFWPAPFGGGFLGTRRNHMWMGELVCGRVAVRPDNIGAAFLVPGRPAHSYASWKTSSTQMNNLPELDSSAVRSASRTDRALKLMTVTMWYPGVNQHPPNTNQRCQTAFEENTPQICLTVTCDVCGLLFFNKHWDIPPPRLLCLWIIFSFLAVLLQWLNMVCAPLTWLPPGGGTCKCRTVSVAQPAAWSIVKRRLMTAQAATMDLFREDSL